jgi:hypothetical protein
VCFVGPWRQRPHWSILPAHHICCSATLARNTPGRMGANGHSTQHACRLQVSLITQSLTPDTQPAHRPGIGRWAAVSQPSWTGCASAGSCPQSSRAKAAGAPAYLPTVLLLLLLTHCCLTAGFAGMHTRTSLTWPTTLCRQPPSKL